MIENLEEKSIENNKDEVEQTNRIPLEYRNPFQIEVFKMLIISEKLKKEDVAETERYGKIISDFIDSPNNVAVRELILQKKFKEAAELMVIEISEEENHLKAA